MVCLGFFETDVRYLLDVGVCVRLNWKINKANVWKLSFIRLDQNVSFIRETISKSRYICISIQCVTYLYSPWLYVLHSTTTWYIRAIQSFNDYVYTILPFFDHLPLPTWTILYPKTGQKMNFCTTYPPLLVQVVIEWPLIRPCRGRLQLYIPTLWYINVCVMQF